MILHCDICGKFFDTDYEIGDEVNGVCFCENCAEINNKEKENEND